MKDEKMEKTQESIKTSKAENQELISIPSELDFLQIPAKEGNFRFLTSTEKEVIAYTKQYPNAKFSARTLSRRLSLSSITVRNAVKTLTQAGLMKAKA